MQTAPKELLIEILKIINYRNNREAFILEFEAMSYMEAMVDVVDQLPDDLAEKVKKGKFDAAWVKENISKEMYVDQVDKVFGKKIDGLIEAVSPVLNLAQKQKITELMRN